MNSIRSLLILAAVQSAVASNSLPNLESVNDRVLLTDYRYKGFRFGAVRGDGYCCHGRKYASLTIFHLLTNRRNALLHQQRKQFHQQKPLFGHKCLFIQRKRLLRQQKRLVHHQDCLPHQQGRPFHHREPLFQNPISMLLPRGFIPLSLH